MTTLWPFNWLPEPLATWLWNTRALVWAQNLEALRRYGWPGPRILWLQTEWRVEDLDRLFHAS